MIMDDYTPIKISWSSLSRRELCASKDYLHIGKKSPATDIRNFFGGSVCDRVMRAWLEADEQIPGAMVGMVEEILEREEQAAVDGGDGVVKWRNSADKKLLTIWCKDLVTRLEPILNHLVLPYDYEPAMRFKTLVKLPYTEDEARIVELVGEMDILVRDTQFNIFDLKATENPYYYKKCIGQLIFYDIALQCMFNERPRQCGIIQPMLPDSVLSFTFTADDYRQMWVRIHKYAIDVWRGNNDPKVDNKGCLVCEVNFGCEKYKIVDGKAPIVGRDLLHE